MNATKKTVFRVLFLTITFVALTIFFQTGQSASPFSPDPLPTIQTTLFPGVEWVTVRDLNVETTTIWQENSQVFGISEAVINSARDAALYQELIAGRLNSLPDEQVLTAEVTFKAPLTLVGIESLLGDYIIISLLASGDDGSTGHVRYPPEEVPVEFQAEFSQVYEALSGGTPAPSLSPDNYIAATVKASALLLRELSQKERVYTVDVGPIDLIGDFPGGNFSPLKDVSYDYELHVGSLCEFGLLRNRIDELSANGQIPESVKDELQTILTNAEAYLIENDIASARNEMALYFETLDENSATIIESALKEADIVGDCLLARQLQSDPVVTAGGDQTISLGESVTVTATYADADNTENHSARIDWGDGIVEDVPVTMTGPGAGEVTNEHTYVSAGNYAVEVCVTDLYGGVGCDTFNVTVRSFPSTSILDDFNRANGGIGSNWSGNTAGYNISSNQLSVDYHGSNNDIYWKNEPFGANQEAYVTFSQVDLAGNEQTLLLKSQSNATWGDGVLEAFYDALNERVQVVTWDWPQGWVQHGADIPVTFANGDQFGARAFADGTVEVYKNGTLLATRDITAWAHYADGGYVGLWFIDAEDAVLDNFGGGTVPGLAVEELETLDDFNRANGAIGGNWSGATNKYSISSNQLQVGSAGYGHEIYWNSTSFDADQEAHFTFTQVNTSATAQGLVLKAQSNTGWGNGLLEVSYVAPLNVAQVWTYTPSQGWVQRGQNIPVTFANGDRFSVRALSNGDVEVYRNGILFGKRNVTSWQYYDDGGYIGVGFVSASGAKVDDFGGGTLTGGMQSMMAGGGEAFSTSETLEADAWNVEFGSAGQFWQGVPLGTNQTASVTVTNTQTSLRPKPESNGVWGKGTVQVLYDVPNQRIQVWQYDTAKGWMHVGKDIPVKFVAGDTFSVRVLPDGTLEISRNGKLLAKRDVTP